MDKSMLTADRKLHQNPDRTLVKICGVTTIHDAIAAVRAGADAIGINFFQGSPRCVDADQAKRIVDAVATLGNATTFGVFVDSSTHQIASLMSQTGLDVVQLHGDQPVEVVRQLIAWPVFRAFRFQGQKTAAAMDLFLGDCLKNDSEVGLLLDAYDSSAFGGTGQTVDWSQLAKHFRCECPWLLAGGLNPENVIDAIQTCRPWGVDVASGVERSPGIKDIRRVEMFLDAVRSTDQLRP